MSTITLSHAEIQYLITLVGEAELGGVRSALRLSEPANEEVAEAGLSSLYLRGLATVRAGSIYFGQEVAGIAHIVAHAARRIELEFVSAAATEAAQVWDSPDGRLMVRPRLLRSFDVTGLTLDVSLSAVIVDLTSVFLTAARPSIVFLQAWHANECVRVSVGVDEDGDWFVATQDVGANKGEAVTREQALRQIVRCVEDESAPVLQGRPHGASS